MSTQYFVILFLGISPGELMIVLLVVLVLFGPRKIPEIARTLGKGLNDLKKAQQDLNTEINSYTGDIEKEATNLKSEVENALNEDSQKPLDNSDGEFKDSKDDNNEVPGDDDKSANDDKTDDDNDDDLPYPYNKNLKA